MKRVIILFYENLLRRLVPGPVRTVPVMPSQEGPQDSFTYRRQIRKGMWGLIFGLVLSTSANASGWLCSCNSTVYAKRSTCAIKCPSLKCFPGECIKADPDESQNKCDTEELSKREKVRRAVPPTVNPATLKALLQNEPFANELVDDPSLAFVRLMNEATSGAHYILPDYTRNDAPTDVRLHMTRTLKANGGRIYVVPNDPGQRRSRKSKVSEQIHGQAKGQAMNFLFGKVSPIVEFVLDVGVVMANVSEVAQLKQLARTNPDALRLRAQEVARRQLTHKLAMELSANLKNYGDVEHYLHAFYEKGNILFRHNKRVLARKGEVKPYPCIRPPRGR